MVIGSKRKWKLTYIYDTGRK